MFRGLYYSLVRLQVFFTWQERNKSLNPGRSRYINKMFGQYRNTNTFKMSSNKFSPTYNFINMNEQINMLTQANMVSMKIVFSQVMNLTSQLTQCTYMKWTTFFNGQQTNEDNTKFMFHTKSFLAIFLLLTMAASQSDVNDFDLHLVKVKWRRWWTA